MAGAHESYDGSKAHVIMATPLASSYDEQIRPLLDAIDRLRQLQVVQEGIQLPTIVVIGDQSSGKSSVLESLAGISLPRAQGICTRVPLVMRLKNDPTKPTPALVLEYQGKSIPTSEDGINAAITTATDEIAGNGKGVSNTPLTLVVRKNGVPDLTMVDLPGITRVPVHGQPEDIYEQISDMILEYISPKESIILNVLSATVDFPTCESIRMSQRVDKSGERTVAVVTKPDKLPEGLLEKVTADDVNIGLGYVIVRNRIGNESYEEARANEAELFDSHPLLSKIDKSIVGVTVLAQRLVEIQAGSIARCLPDIVKNINEKLSATLTELERMPRHLSSLFEATTVMMRILGSTKESLRKLLVRGEFDEFPENKDMHSTARLAEMLDKYSEKFPSMFTDVGNRFLVDVIAVLEESKTIGLPNFLPRTAFTGLLKQKLNKILESPGEFVLKVWDYIETVVTNVLLNHWAEYHSLQLTLRKVVGILFENMRRESRKYVMELVGMESAADYTSNPDYDKMLTTLMQSRSAFVELLHRKKKMKFTLPEVGRVRVDHLDGSTKTAEQAFDMGMRLNAYWKCVKLRLVDGIALHLLYSVRRLVDVELEKHLVEELFGNNAKGIAKMLNESPSIAAKRERLRKSVELLEHSKSVLANVMDAMNPEVG